jgi:hypothetical protein
MSRGKDVGYCSPPKGPRFKPGQSGNPKGRPRGSLNLTTVLAGELGERITVRENGRSLRVSKQLALLKTLIAKALQGDVKAIGTVLTLSARLFGDADERDDTSLDREELAILRKYAPQFLKQPKAKRR